jgi:hypothetical protein
MVVSPPSVKDKRAYKKACVANFAYKAFCRNGGIRKKLFSATKKASQKSDV